jgi:hypothetical protein
MKRRTFKPSIRAVILINVAIIAAGIIVGLLLTMTR